jgi:hypothetical protein
MFGADGKFLQFKDLISGRSVGIAVGQVSSGKEAIMAGRSRTLQVPYYAQPTGITCQSTTLKMFAGYLENNVVNQSTVGGAKEIQDIWKEVNEGPGRPSKLRNAHANMKWWLEKYFPTVHFTYETLTRDA